MIRHDRQLQEAFALLKQQDWERGFPLFESREIQKVPFALGVKTPLTRAPIWTPGMDVRGRHIIVLPEQGYGDTIQFARFIPLLEKLPIESISVAMSRQMNPLVSTLGYPVLIGEDCKTPAMRVKVMSLPALLLQYGIKITDGDKIISSSGYFTVADVKKTKQIGFCWYTENTSWNDKAKKIPQELAENFYKSLCKKKKSVVSLQIQPDFMPQYLTTENWLGTAEKIKALDVVVTVDTAVAHLAGALGVRTINLIGAPEMAGWQYFPVDSDKTPWYDSMELIWYKPYTNWEAGLNEALKKICR